MTTLRLNIQTDYVVEHSCLWLCLLSGLWTGTSAGLCFLGGIIVHLCVCVVGNISCEWTFSVGVFIRSYSPKQLLIATEASGELSVLWPDPFTHPREALTNVTKCSLIPSQWTVCRALLSPTIHKKANHSFETKLNDCLLIGYHQRTC